MIFKEEGKEKWSGPAKVTSTEGNKIRIVHNGYERTVPACNVMPYNQERYVIEEFAPDDEQKANQRMDINNTRMVEGSDPADGLKNERMGEKIQTAQGLDIETQSKMVGGSKSADRLEDKKLERKQKPSQELDIDTLNQSNSEMRPNKNQIIEFKVGGVLKVGKVSKVGKASGRDKHRCWIKLRDGKVSKPTHRLEDENKAEECYDFVKDVQCWKVIKKVTFDNQAEDKVTMEKKSEEETNGIWFLRHKECCVEPYETPEDITEVFAINIPTKQHHHPEVVEAKEKELSKWKEFKAADEVEFTGKQHVLSSRWVITRKSDGSVKARLVVRGFEEIEYPQSDSPTASNNSLKLFFALAANERMKIQSMDVTSAFLQGQPLKRNVFMEPPAERQKEGVIWKLNKSVYGLYDASRKWFQAVNPELLHLGTKPVSGDEACFSMVKDGQLVGLCILHVDDFLVAGKPSFLSALDNQLKGRFKFGKVETDRFKFTGLNIEQQDSLILVDQIDFINGIKPIFSPRAGKKNSGEKLNKQETKLYRGLTGQLGWAADNTRPDLAYDVRELATKTKDACLKDLQKANKVLKKAQKDHV